MKTLSPSLIVRMWLCMAASLTLVISAHGDMRTWTSKGGGYKITADFVSATATEVTLKREDGSEQTIPIKKLSASDQAYIKGRMKPMDRPVDEVLKAGVKKVDRMKKIAIGEIVADPKMTFAVADFTGSIAELVHGGAEMNVGGFKPESGFAFGVLRILMSPVKAPAVADVCGFYLESPRGTRYPVHLMVVDALGGKEGKRTLRDLRSMELVAKVDEAVIDNSYVFMIPADADFTKFKLGFEAPEAGVEIKTAPPE